MTMVGMLGPLDVWSVKTYATYDSASSLLNISTVHVYMSLCDINVNRIYMTFPIWSCMLQTTAIVDIKNNFNIEKEKVNTIIDNY